MESAHIFMVSMNKQLSKVRRKLWQSAATLATTCCGE